MKSFRKSPCSRKAIISSGKPSALASSSEDQRSNSWLDAATIHLPSAAGWAITTPRGRALRIIWGSATSGRATRLGAIWRRVSRTDRKSVGSGKRVSVRVDLGGRRIIKKKKQTKKQ